METAVSKLGLELPSKSAVRKCIAKCKLKYKCLQRNSNKKGHKTDLELFLEEDFRLSQRCASVSAAIIKASRKSARDDSSMVEGYRETIKSLGQELNFGFSCILHLDFKRDS